MKHRKNAFSLPCTSTGPILCVLRSTETTPSLFRAVPLWRSDGGDGGGGVGEPRDRAPAPVPVPGAGVPHAPHHPAGGAAAVAHKGPLPPGRAQGIGRRHSCSGVSVYMDCTIVL